MGSDQNDILTAFDRRHGSNLPDEHSDEFCVHRFRTALNQLPLFQKSRWNFAVAQLVPILTAVFRRRRSALPSSVVSQMTLWEQFLAHRCRRSRQMTFAVAFRNANVNPQTYVVPALQEVLNLVFTCGDHWENQPLDVEVACRRGASVDPRRKVSQQIGIGIVNERREQSVFAVDICRMARLTSAECSEYLQQRVRTATRGDQPVSLVFDLRSRHAENFAGSYTDFKGAWLRVAPDAATGGLLMSADHLVLDGGLFQEVLLRTALSCLSETTTRRPGSNPAAARRKSHSTSLRFPRTFSLSTAICSIVCSMDELGISLLQGRDTLLVPVIPKTAEGNRGAIEHRRRRVLPLLMNLEGLCGCDDTRQRIQQLNVSGRHSASAQMWHRLYSGNVPQWLIHYFEKVTPRMPFQRASRYLSGGALLSCLPPIEIPGLCASQITHLSSRTMSPLPGGPSVTVMQVLDHASQQPHAFVTLGGSGMWNCPQQLQRLQQSIQHRINHATTEEQLVPAA